MLVKTRTLNEAIYLLYIISYFYFLSKCATYVLYYQVNNSRTRTLTSRFLAKIASRRSRFCSVFSRTNRRLLTQFFFFRVRYYNILASTVKGKCTAQAPPLTVDTHQYVNIQLSEKRGEGWLLYNHTVGVKGSSG